MSKKYMFIYQKNAELLALTHSEAINQENQLINDNWTHIHTLDVVIWLKYHINTNKTESLIKLLTD